MTSKRQCVCARAPHLDHGGDRMDSAQVLHQALSQISDAHSNGPVSVTLQLNHLIGTVTTHTHTHNNVNKHGYSPVSESDATSDLSDPEEGVCLAAHVEFV